MNNINETAIGDYIHTILEERGWSIRKAAMKTDIAASYISRLINHKANANPKSDTLDKLAYGLNLDRQTVYDKSGRVLVDEDGANVSPELLNNMPKSDRSNLEHGAGFDIAKALDNDEYMLNDGRRLTEDEKAAIKAILRIHGHD